MKKPGSLRRVDIKELEAELGRGEPLLLLDVRTAPEFSRGHVPGAINVPLADIDQGKLPPEGSVPVWLICRSGARSARAAQVLVDRGYDVVDVSGGTMAWRRAGLPVDPPNMPLPLGPPLLLSLTLGLAPFAPEPHIVGKLRWLAGGAVGMGPMDWFDLALHGAPWVWLIVALVQRLIPRQAPASSDP
jgi:rhodanese-related sulfurtransferase